MRKTLFPLVAMLFLCRSLSAQAVGDYQTISGGTWSNAAIWQTWNGAAWVATGTAPNNTNGTITVLSGHMVNITAALTIDQVVVNGTVNLKNVALTVANGAGDDLIINGCFEDSSNTTVGFNAGAAWSIAAGATLIRCGAGGPNIWQTSYSGGIATIPPTANWISRKSGTSNPSLTTIGAYYPNLTIENKTANSWVTVTGATFNGAGGYPTVLGNLNIGGTQTGVVDFLSNCTNAQALIVYGNTTIKSGCKFRNFGTGIELRGDLTVNGEFHYNGGTGTRKLIFSGSNTQNVSGTGWLNIYALQVNKSGGTVTLSRTFVIDNSATFTSGTITSSATYPVAFMDNATVVSIAASSFVNGPVVKYDNGSSGNFTFPVGKNADYQSIGMTGAAPAAFWTETFSNGCASGCLAGTYTGPNGTWSVTSTGTNDATNNPWYISYAEDGNAQGVCGSATNSDPSLHVGSNSIGDAGAAYDAGGACGIFYCVTTNLRAESPAINCTGKSNLQLAFNYIEFGSGTNDNCTLWYYDGSSWSQLVDIPKSYCCGGVNCNGLLQGLWQTYRIALPASANNNANVKIGFNWTNNDDGAGSDPSFAVDDITITNDYYTAEYFYTDPQVVYNNVLAPTLTSISACEYWTLNRNASSGSKSVTLAWDANSCPAITALTDVMVARFDGSMWQDEGQSATTGSTSAGTVTSLSTVGGFGPFTLALIPPTPLPVKLLHFSGACVQDGVQLDWSTATETNNDYFTIERSSDGVEFVRVGMIPGAGNSGSELHYTFTDTDPARGMNYYRIRQTDFNGVAEVFSMIAVNAQDCSGGSLDVVNTFFSNDALNGQFIHAETGAQLSVYAANGTLIYQSDTGSESGYFTIPAAGWAHGLYFIRVSDGFSTVSKAVLK